MKAHSIPVAELDDAQALAIIERTGWRRKRKTYAAFIMKRFICFLNGRGLARPPSPRTAKEIARAELKGDYESYLRRQRGLSERTIFHCWRFADRFLEFRFGYGASKALATTTLDLISLNSTRYSVEYDKGIGNWHLDGKLGAGSEDQPFGGKVNRYIVEGTIYYRFAIK